VIHWPGEHWDGPLALVPALGAILITGVVLWGLMQVGLNLSADFVIRSRGGGRVSVRGRIPAGKVPAIREFFARDLGASGPVTVRGSFGGGRAVRLRFSGRLSPGQQQRARNFLVDHLR